MSDRLFAFLLTFLGLVLFTVAIVLAEQTPGTNEGYQVLGFGGVVLAFVGISAWSDL